MSNLFSPEVQQKYKDEWLLFEVVQADEKGQPKEVKLIGHSKVKEEIYKKAVELKVQKGLFFYNGEAVPEGYHVAL